MSRDRLPPLAALRVFETCARHESFKAAAEELFVTPGAVSQQIRLLEEHIGTELFVRDSRRVIMTDTAKAAANSLREGFEKLFEANRIMRQGLKKGRVTVSVAPSFASKWLMPRLYGFNMAHPDIDVWVSSDMAMVDFAVSDVDLAIRYGPGSYAPLAEEMLLSESVVIVCAPALFEKAPIKRYADLAHHRLLHDLSAETDPSFPDWAMWLKARGVDGVDSSRGARFNQTHLVIEQAVAGRGIALTKARLAAGDISSGRLQILFEEHEKPLPSAYHLVWPANRPVTKAMQFFMDWLRVQAEQSFDQISESASDSYLNDPPVFAAHDI
jgi:LysR family transcriptional regulator, glycine cleavage system transcriptional activator